MAISEEERQLVKMICQEMKQRGASMESILLALDVIGSKKELEELLQEVRKYKELPGKMAAWVAMSILPDEEEEI